MVTLKETVVRGLKIKMRKYGGIVISRVLLAAMLTGLVPLIALAAPGSFRIEQAQTEMPRVDVWLIAEEGDFAGAELSARLGGAPLALTELRPYDPAKDATAYYFIVDCSTSVTPALMSATREALTGLAENMGPDDTMTLITFGLEVDVVLNREKDIGRIAGAVAGLTANQRGTLFYEGLAKAQELASNSNYALERKLAFVFSMRMITPRAARQKMRWTGFWKAAICRFTHWGSTTEARRGLIISARWRGSPAGL